MSKLQQASPPTALAVAFVFTECEDAKYPLIITHQHTSKKHSKRLINLLKNLLVFNNLFINFVTSSQSCVLRHTNCTQPTDNQHS